MIVPRQCRSAPSSRNRHRTRKIRWSLPLLVVMLISVQAERTTAWQHEPASKDQKAETLDGREGRNLALDQFRPTAKLKVSARPPERPKFPIVDVHVHPKARFHHSPDLLDQFVQLMDEQGILVCVSLDGGMKEELEEHLKYLWTRYRDRFVVFANIDWRGDGKEDDPATWDCQRPDFGRRMALELARAKERGVCGLKVFKDLGLTIKNSDGSAAQIDDPRWDPIWQACGELGFPVLIHSADPSAFFDPIDQYNERWEELRRHPDWSFYGPQFPSRDALHRARLNVVSRFRQTTFIAAHLGNDGEDLAEVSKWLDENPNLFVDLASRIAELGRQPYTAREFFLKYADRILFGTDGPRSRERMLPHWRFLETRDEYFPYAENPFPPQGLWNIYGINLPDDVLKKVYHENALRIIPTLREKFELVKSR